MEQDNFWNEETVKDMVEYLAKNFKWSRVQAVSFSQQFKEKKSNELLEVPVEISDIGYITRSKGKEGIIFTISKPIPQNKFPAIKQAIENVLNDIPNPSNTYTEKESEPISTNTADYKIENYEFIEYPQTKAVDQRNTKIPHCVTRLSDNTRWTKGEIVNSTWGPQKITAFVSGKDKKMVVEFETGRNQLSEISKYNSNEQTPPTTDKQDDWEILSFKRVQSDQVEWELIEGGMYQNIKSKSNGFSLDGLLGTHEDDNIASVKSGKISIHSVKRLSDQAIFTVGDKVGYITELENHFRNVEKFTIKDGNIYINENYIGQPDVTIFSWFINPTQPSPSTDTPILFTTEDGVDMPQGYKGNLWRVFTLPNSYESWKPYDLGMPQYINLGEKYFAEKQNVDQYIVDNKPCLSRNEVMGIVRRVEDATTGHVNRSYINNELYYLINKKLNPNA